ncbi:MAG: septum formation initiator family protein [Candidatus Omnitrophica bacterium]|nr:septum formation initiator family protein [Candidatus Omnitrophota bacterium]
MSRKRLVLLGIIVLLIIFFPGYSKLQQLRAKNRLLREKIESLKQENEDLAGQIEKLENDPFYIEKRTRDKMGVGKKGEIRYKIIYDEDSDGQDR